MSCSPRPKPEATFRPIGRLAAQGLANRSGGTQLPFGHFWPSAGVHRLYAAQLVNGVATDRHPRLWGPIRSEAIDNAESPASSLTISRARGYCFETTELKIA